MITQNIRSFLEELVELCKKHKVVISAESLEDYGYNGPVITVREIYEEGWVDLERLGRHGWKEVEQEEDNI